jgi:hypothetical protein
MGKGFSDPHYLIVSCKWYNNIRTVMHKKQFPKQLFAAKLKKFVQEVLERTNVPTCLAFMAKVK